MADRRDAKDDAGREAGQSRVRTLGAGGTSSPQVQKILAPPGEPAGSSGAERDAVPVRARAGGSGGSSNPQLPRQAVSASDVPPGSSGELDSPFSSGARANRKRKPGESGTAGVPRTGSRVITPGMSGPPPPKRRLRRFLWSLFLLTVAGGGGATYWQLKLLPQQNRETLAAIEKRPAPAILKPVPAPAPPPLVLPVRGKDGSLPRAFQSVGLGHAGEALDRQQKPEPAPATDSWCALFRRVNDPLAQAIGYNLAAGKCSQISVRYRKDAAAVTEAWARSLSRKTYGEPASSYTYRDQALHKVWYWEDAHTLVKLDIEQDGSQGRLHSFHILDKGAR